MDLTSREECVSVTLSDLFLVLVGGGGWFGEFADR
jgi:hypothetical protein